jgi:hypothetical protein
MPPPIRGCLMYLHFMGTLACQCHAFFAGDAYYGSHAGDGLLLIDTSQCADMYRTLLLQPLSLASHRFSSTSPLWHRTTNIHIWLWRGRSPRISVIRDFHSQPLAAEFVLSAVPDRPVCEHEHTWDETKALSSFHTPAFPTWIRH